MPKTINSVRNYRRAWFYGIVFIVPTSVLIGHAMGGGWHWLTPLLVFGVIPVLDHLLGVDKHNPFPEKAVKAPGIDLWPLSHRSGAPSWMSAYAPSISNVKIETCR